MDSIEVSRRTAERLHQEALSKGHDPCDPYAFACAEANRRNLAVERVPKGDVRLHGGRALYDPDSLLVLHENSGDSFTDAFLVSHEVGHVEHGGENQIDSSITADPLRSSETAPIGVDRVIDYSRRERREVQMDLFAREFLLPRSWVRHMHLEESMSASRIAAKCKAPHEVVYQQLLDALLLPEIAPAAKKESKESPLNDDQKAAVIHRAKPFLLEAGPGTGKTRSGSAFD